MAVANINTEFDDVIFDKLKDDTTADDILDADITERNTDSDDVSVADSSETLDSASESNTNGNIPITDSEIESLDENIIEAQNESQDPKESIAVKEKRLFSKLETYRTTHYSVIGKSKTCYNIHYFVVIFSVILFLKSCVSSYMYAVSYEIGKRYYAAKYEMDFIVGVERIGFVITLIFSSYYGNKFFKPISIICGAVICGIATIMCAIPYFMLKERETDNNGDVPDYVKAGLCYTGASVNTSFSEQCLHHPSSSSPEENKGSYSLLCTAHFFLGIGSAFLIPAGVVYADEAEKTSETPLFIGIFLGSYGLGEIIGALFGYWFVSYPEDLSGDILISQWHIGAWWIGFPVFGSLLIVIPFFLLIFPRWIKEPKWLLYRKYRHALRLERWKKREAEARRARRKKKKEQLRKERERRNIKAKRKEGADNDVFESGEESDQQVNADASEDIASNENNATDKANGHKEDVNKNKSKQKAENSTSVSENGKEKVSKGKSKKLPEGQSSGNNDNIEDNRTNSENVKSSAKAKSEGHANGRVYSTAERKERYKKGKQGKPVRATSKNEVTESGSAKDEGAMENGSLSPAEEKRRAAIEKNRQRYKLGRNIQDLPKNLKFLVLRPLFLIVTFGATLSLYLQGGYYRELPRYFHEQFQYSERDSFLIPGVVIGLGIAVGTVISGVIIFKTKMTLKKQLKYSLILQTGTLVSILILMAMGCTVSEGPVYEKEQLETIDSDSSEKRVVIHTSCAPLCDCSMSQLSRVCDETGSMSYLSPCHAGCKSAFVDEESDNHLHYTECECDANGKVAPEWCENHCKYAPVFIIFLLVAVILQSMGFVTIILVMIRSHPEKLRSLTLGFSFWLIYVIAFVPGAGIYNYFYKSACLLYNTNCQEDKECWSVDRQKYRYVTHGATIAFLSGGLVLLIGSYFVLLKVLAKSSKPRSNSNNDKETSRNNIQMVVNSDSNVPGGSGVDNNAFKNEESV